MGAKNYSKEDLSSCNFNLSGKFIGVLNLHNIRSLCLH